MLLQGIGCAEADKQERSSAKRDGISVLVSTMRSWHAKKAVATVLFILVLIATTFRTHAEQSTALSESAHSHSKNDCDS